MGLNKVKIGICLIGDFDQATPHNDSLELLARLCRSLMDQFGIPPENVIGHWEAQAIGGVPVAKRKTCPGSKFNMEDFRKRIRQ
jgi:N-acetyl-anhydromuramyl-L-alanine amidase AmpD